MDRYPLLCNRSSAILIIEKLTKSCLGGLLQRCSTFIQQFTRPKSLRLKDLSKYTTNNQDEKDEPMIKIGCIMSYFRSISGVDPIATTRHPFEVLSQLMNHSRFHRSQPVDPIAIPRRPFELLFGETLRLAGGFQHSSQSSSGFTNQYLGGAYIQLIQSV